MQVTLVIIRYFFLFYFFYFYGKSLFTGYQKFSGEKTSYILNVKVNYYYPLVGIAFFSNVLVIINFFSPLQKTWISILIVLIPLILNFDRSFKLKISKGWATPILFIPLLFSFYNNTPSPDAYMYHFVHQQYLLKERIVFGLSNLFPNLGFSSIIEYSSVLFWNGDVYSNLNFVNILFIAGFYYYIIGLWSSENIYLKNTSLIILSISLLDNFGFEGGRNGFFFIQEIGKFDSSFGIVFFIGFVSLLTYIHQEQVSKIDYYFLFLFILFVGQIKANGFILFFPLIFTVFIKERSGLFSIISKNTLFLVTTASWSVRSLINTSCLVFPVETTCVKYLSWSFPYQAKLLSQSVISNNRNPEIPYAAYGNFDWITSYWIQENRSYIINFTITIFLLFFLSFSKTRKNNDISYLVVLFFAILNISIWFFFFPNYRFSAGFFMSLYLILLYKNLFSISSFFGVVQKSFYFFFIMLVLSVGSIVRVDSYKSALNDINMDFNQRYTVPQQLYIKKIDSFGVSPTNGKCIINLECTLSEYKIDQKVVGKYKIFIPKNVNYNIQYLESLNSQN